MFGRLYSGFCLQVDVCATVLAKPAKVPSMLRSQKTGRQAQRGLRATARRPVL